LQIEQFTYFNLEVMVIICCGQGKDANVLLELRACLRNNTVTYRMRRGTYMKNYHKLTATRIKREMNISLAIFFVTLLIQQLQITLGFQIALSSSQHQLTTTCVISKSKAFFATRQHNVHTTKICARSNSRLFLSDSLDGYDGGDSDSNKWASSDSGTGEDGEDWEQQLQNKEDGTFWSSFESNDEEDSGDSTNEESLADAETEEEEDDDGEAFLDAISAISADEIDFMNTEAERADKVRQMQEWGFEPETISNALGVAIDDSLETEEGDELLEEFFEETAETGFGMQLDDDTDLETVESHQYVDVDEETGEPVRSQMVYVDEYECIGCYNCAMVAQSTFFMEQEHGRARVFQQWGDDDETIAIVIDTCPVDCIHYIPFDELVDLEVGRRDQVINYKSRLVNGNNSGAHRVGGTAAYTAPQKISGNTASRCNNCPSKGCKDCPMYGIGENPAFAEREQKREERAVKKRIREQRENAERSVEL